MHNEISHYKDPEQFTCQYGELIAMVNHLLQHLKIFYSVALLVAEIGYIYNIFELCIEDFSWQPSTQPRRTTPGLISG